MLVVHVTELATSATAIKKPAPSEPNRSTPRVRHR
jgi:hypothetical protein